MAKRRGSKPNLPTSDAVWQRVVDFARECLRENRPVFTVDRRVENRITDVKAGSIGRFSAQGTSNVSRVTRAMVDYLWSEITDGPSVGSYLYFTKALLLGALPGVVEDMDGDLVIRNDPEVLETKARRKEFAQDEGRGRGGGEGALHRQLKEFIYREPDRALAGLKTGPYQSVAMEYIMPTGDRVDVFLIDGTGNMLLVEVKPFLDADDLAPFAQAAKYRLLWHILRERPVDEIRCLVAAPAIAGAPWKKMLSAHRVECVAVKPPKGLQA